MPEWKRRLEREAEEKRGEEEKRRKAEDEEREKKAAVAAKVEVLMEMAENGEISEGELEKRVSALEEEDVEEERVEDEVVPTAAEESGASEKRVEEVVGSRAQSVEIVETEGPSQTGRKRKAANEFVAVSEPVSCLFYIRIFLVSDKVRSAIGVGSRVSHARRTRTSGRASGA